MPVSRCASATFLLTIVACSDPTGDGGTRPAELRLLASPTSTGTPGWPLTDSVVVEVLDAQGNPLPEVQVNWNGSGRIFPEAVKTNSAGRLAAAWTLGPSEGEQTMTASVSFLPPVSVSATGVVFHAQQVTLGSTFACAISLGRVYCWGNNRYGQMGIGTTTANELVRVPEPVNSDMIFSDITAGGGHVCGLVDGAAYCWGSNESGETGTGTAGAAVLTPTPVMTALRFVQISAEGQENFNNSTCAVTAQGEVWCWGDNAYGKLGNGTLENSPVPVRVQTDVAFHRVETGYFHACALTDLAALWCWGEQETDGGGLGPRLEGFYTTPVSVASGYRFRDLSLGRNWTCGLTLEDRAYCWGANWFGSLGVPEESSPDPVSVMGDLEFLSLSAGSMEENIGLTSDRLLYRWGSIGNDNIQIEPVPVIQGLRFISADPGEFPFERGAGGTCGIASVGRGVYCVDDQGLTPRGVPLPDPPDAEGGI